MLAAGFDASSPLAVVDCSLSTPTPLHMQS